MVVWVCNRVLIWHIWQTNHSVHLSFLKICHEYEIIWNQKEVSLNPPRLDHPMVSQCWYNTFYIICEHLSLFQPIIIWCQFCSQSWWCGGGWSGWPWPRFSRPSAWTQLACCQIAQISPQFQTHWCQYCSCKFEKHHFQNCFALLTCIIVSLVWAKMCLIGLSNEL